MRVIATIALLLLFALAGPNLFAQNANGAAENANQPKTVTAKKVEPSVEKTAPNKLEDKTLRGPNEGKEKGAHMGEGSDMPYYRYNGIEDLKKAKEAWAADQAKKSDNNPVYYRYKGIENLDEAKEAWVKDHPEEYKRSLNKTKN